MSGKFITKRKAILLDEFESLASEVIRRKKDYTPASLQLALRVRNAFPVSSASQDAIADDLNVS